MTDIGAGSALDGASLWIFSPDSEAGTSFWGSWQADSVGVTVDDVAGTMSGTMDFLEEAGVYDTGTLQSDPATWSQEVTVTWSFDPTIHRRDVYTIGHRTGGFQPPL